MRYIKRIILDNFQSYKHEIIDLKPGLNLILGSSDSGKSAILRAISFVIYNYPRNNTLIHEGTTETQVALEFSDNTKVTRIKGEKNSYIAVTPDNQTIILDKIDKTIPDEIKALLHYPPEDDLNGFISYADQFAKMFLVDLSPTDLPRSLSSLTGIEILEESAKQLMQNYKAIEKQTKNDENNLVKLLNELGAFSFIDDYDKKLSTLKSQVDKIQNTENELYNLSQYDIVLNLTSFDHLGLFNSKIKSLDKILSAIKRINVKVNEFDKLHIFNLVNNKPIDKNDINRLNEVLLQCDAIEKQIDNAIVVNNLHETAIDTHIHYLQTKNNSEVFSNDYIVCKQNLEKAEKELECFKQKLIDEGIKCAVCGSILQ